MVNRTAVPALAAFLCSMVLACARDTRTPTSLDRPVLSTSGPLDLSEGELLGKLFLNGVAITDSGYTVELEPQNSQTSNRLHHFNGTMWVKPTPNGANWMFSWIDPRHQGCDSSEAAYVRGDLLGRHSEVHQQNDTTPPSGPETHCIQPGNYTLTIRHNGLINKTFDIDYVPIMTSQGNTLAIWNATAGVSETIEKLNYDDTSYMHSDVIVRVDVGAPGYSDTPVLYGDSVVGTNPDVNQTFADLATLSGTHHTWFRFSSVSSSTTESSSDKGRLLSRVYFDSAADLTKRTGFWDSHSNSGVIRINQFMWDTTSTRQYVVGLETMRPDEQPRTTPEVTRVVSIQGPPPPPPPPFDSVHVIGPLTVKPNQTCEWVLNPYGGIRPFSYAWYQNGALVGTDDYVDLAVGTSGFALKGQATDSLSRTRSKTVTITVSMLGSRCYLRPGR